MTWSGAPGAIRTPDPQIRSLVLYPAELRARRLHWWPARGGPEAAPPIHEGGSALSSSAQPMRMRRRQHDVEARAGGERRVGQACRHAPRPARARWRGRGRCRRLWPSPRRRRTDCRGRAAAGRGRCRRRRDRGSAAVSRERDADRGRRRLVGRGLDRLARVLHQVDQHARQLLGVGLDRDAVGHVVGESAYRDGAAAPASIADSSTSARRSTGTGLGGVALCRP